MNRVKFHVPERNARSAIDFNGLLQDSEFNPAGPGDFAMRVQEWLQELVGAKRALLTSSGTSALELMALLLDLKPGDEVIMPSWTFTSTANAFLIHGAKIVFADIDPITLNLSVEQTNEAISERTRAIIPINYAGISADYTSLNKIIEGKQIFILEDNAHGLGGRSSNSMLGANGRMSAQSFHATKNLQAGEGGALLINDKSFIERAEVCLEKGTNRSAFIRGEVDKYRWRDIGSSFVMSEISSAFLYSNSLHFSESQARRQVIWNIYEQTLTNWANENQVRIPAIPKSTSPALHIFWLIFETPSKMERFRVHMRDLGVDTSTHYVPLHSAPAASRFDCDVNRNFDVTNYAGSSLVRLPLYSSLTDSQVCQIVDSVKSFH